MSGLGFNKIAGAVLATALGVVGLNEVSGMVFEPEMAKKPGMIVEIKVGPDGPEKPDLLPDWGTVLPTADVAKGQSLFDKCTSCHKPTDVNDKAPGLLGVVGRAPASHPGWEYSAAMKAHAAVDPKWTYDALYQFLKKPGKYVPDTKMTFAGFGGGPNSSQDRINLIAYLHTLGSSLPIPAPDPSRAPAAAAPAAGAEGAAAPASAAPAAGAAPAAPVAADPAKH